MTLNFQDEGDTCDDVVDESGTNMASNESTDPIATIAREALMSFVNGEMNNVSM